MKHIVTRTVVGLSLLLTLVAFFGGINPIPAHADGLQRVDCNTGNPVRIRTDFGQNVDCFDGGTGVISGITLYNADLIYTGDAASVLICYQDDGQLPTLRGYPGADTLYSIDDGSIDDGSIHDGQADALAMNVNQVQEIIVGVTPPPEPVLLHPSSCE